MNCTLYYQCIKCREQGEQEEYYPFIFFTSIDMFLENTSQVIPYLHRFDYIACDSKFSELGLSKEDLSALFK